MTTKTGGSAVPRLKDVAEAAGVSVKTVSNVVNGSVQVAETLWNAPLAPVTA